MNQKSSTSDHSATSPESIVFRDLSSGKDAQVVRKGVPAAKVKTSDAEETGYFLLDLGQVRRMQDLGGGTKEVGAYLALLASTNASNSITCGGEKSIHEYTGLSRGVTKTVMTWLIENDFVHPLIDRHAKGSYALRALLPWSGWAAHFTDLECLQLEQFILEQSVDNTAKVTLVQRACSEGLIIKDDLDRFSKITPRTLLAHVPNAFIRRKSGTSSLERLVRAEQGAALIDALILMRFSGGGQDAVVSMDTLSREMASNATMPFRQLELHRFDIGAVDCLPKCVVASDSELGELPESFPESFPESLKILERYGIVEWLVFAGPKKLGVPVACEEYLGTIHQSTVVTDGVAGMAALLANALHKRISEGVEGSLDLGKLEHACKDQHALFLPRSRYGAPIAAVFVLRFTDRSGKISASEDAIQRAMRRSAEDLTETLLLHFPSEKALAKEILRRRKS